MDQGPFQGAWLGLEPGTSGSGMIVTNDSGMTAPDWQDFQNTPAMEEKQ